jgi:C_GCAxxG_C_C family probable redox protein
MSRTSDAVEKFLQGYACTQVILTQYCEQFDLNPDTAMKLAAGFAAGMRMGKTCGAVTGAYMVLGLKYSGENCDQPEGRKNVYNAVCEFTEKFIRITGTVECKELLGCDVDTEAGMQEARQKDLFKTICPKFVRISAEILDEMIQKEK